MLLLSVFLPSLLPFSSKIKGSTTNDGDNNCFITKNVDIDSKV